MAIPKGPGKAGKPFKAKAIKEGQVTKKNKESKFKQTPQGKVSLINNKKNGNSKAQKNVDNRSPQKKAKKQINLAEKQKDGQKSPKVSSNKQSQKNKKKVLKNQEEMDDSDEDINEGVSMTEDSAMDEDDDEAVSSNDESAPNIFGESLADDSDEDDDDFDADSDDDNEVSVQKKGVKMFKGVDSAKKVEVQGEDDDEEDEDEDDDDDDSDENDEEEEDEDFDVSKSANQPKNDSDEDDEDEDGDDDDDDDEEDDDGLGLKALIGQSLADDDDDEDFEGGEEEDDDDDDIDESEEEEENASQNNSLNSSTLSTASKDDKVMLTPEEKAEKDRRTIYIGNVPKDIKESRVRSEFGKYGPIQSLRVRGGIPESPKMPYKVATIKKKFHEKCKTVCVFVVYESEDSVTKALEMNGQQLEGNYLRVDRVNQEAVHDPKKTVFVANLPFDVEDNELWEMFNKCGKIDFVRTIRDRSTGGCRGIGYITFKTEDAAALALDLHESKLRKRDIRVLRYVKPKPKQGGGQKRNQEQAHSNSPKKAKIDKRQKKPQGSNQQLNKSDDSFQGQTANAKKMGKKGNKFEKKKKAMAGKLLSKPKKPQ